MKLLFYYLELFLHIRVFGKRLIIFRLLLAKELLSLKTRVRGGDLFLIEILFFAKGEVRWKDENYGLFGRK